MGPTLIYKPQSDKTAVKPTGQVLTAHSAGSFSGYKSGTGQRDSRNVAPIIRPMKKNDSTFASTKVGMNTYNPDSRTTKSNAPVIAQGAPERPLMTEPFKQNALKIFALGGLGEYGKNMMIYEYGNDLLVVDCGIMFPEEELLGIDFVIPDIRYLEENKARIKGMVLTHGHEDHIGGLPYIYPKLDVGLYAGELTAGLIKVKLEEFGINSPKLAVVKPQEKIKLGVFEVEFIQLAHSIPDALAVAINTPEGKMLHVTDWKLDHTPIFNQKTDLRRFAELGEEGIKLLLSESCNAMVPGYTMSERVVGQTFEKIFSETNGRIIVTSFASLINRIQHVINAAVNHKRKVAISGRSMINNVRMAIKLGYLKAPKGIFVDIKTVNHLPDDKVAIMCTGSQGEEFSALARMASGEHRQVSIKSGDTVVISASAIPGNESSIHQNIDSLTKQGAQVIYGKAVDIHTSGHAAQEELKMMLSLVNPEYFMPIHGEYRMLVAHAKLAQEIGIDKERIFVTENGRVIEFYQGKGSMLKTKVQAGRVLVDGLGVGDVGNIVLRDRQAMAKEGVFVVILTIDKQNGKILTSPDIISRGFIYMREREDLVNEARAYIRAMFVKHSEKTPASWDYLKRSIRDEVGQFLFDRTQRRPIVIPVIIEV